MINYARFVNELSAGRLTSPIRKITEIQQAGGPELISFGTGAPNVQCFPFAKMKISTKYGEIDLCDQKLSRALQYGPTQGMPELRNWLLNLQRKLHQSPFYVKHPDDLDLVITPGSQDGLSKIFDMVLRMGDPILIEEPTYPGTLAGLRPFKPKFIRLTVDKDGLDPDSVRRALQSEDAKNVKLLYVQPNCSNPAGVSMTLDRRRQLLKLADEHDLLVVEDDPYYFLRFDHKPLPSLFSLDESGRVLRLDSFSKVMSSGVRLGYVTGHRTLLDRIALHLQASSMHCSSLSQVMVFELLERLGVDGFLKHAQSVASFYSSQCDAMVSIASKLLSNGLAEWNRPDGGMFLWLKVNGVTDTRDMIEKKALEKQVVLAPGNLFYCQSNEPTPYLRASFSNVTPEQMELGIKRLAELIESEQKS